MIVQPLHASIIVGSVPATIGACWALCRAGPMSPSTVYMMNMLLWDLVFVLIGTPNTFGSQSWVAEHLACRLYRAASELVARMSANSLVALAVSEYLSQPRDPRLRAKTERSCLVVMCLWVLTVLQSLGTVSHSKLNKTDCLQITAIEPNKQRLATIVDFTCAFVVPIVMIIVFSVLLITKPTRINNDSKDICFVTESFIRPSAQPAYSKLVIALIFIFIILDIPFYGHTFIVFITETFKIVNPLIDESTTGLLIPVGFWCKYILSFLNPLVIIFIVCRRKNGSSCYKCSCCYMCNCNRKRSKRISNIPILDS
ncbi:B1 bradykinin receptor-like [Bacillus rossius redtenbacheri]|uniref:B1 bradykinin receptor-like n=1 Tax=Bacillus rossius redtenbacheri TaxID=93214 RepID=UPI002FDEECF3